VKKKKEGEEEKRGPLYILSEWSVRSSCDLIMSPHYPALTVWNHIMGWKCSRKVGEIYEFEISTLGISFLEFLFEILLLEIHVLEIHVLEIHVLEIHVLEIHVLEIHVEFHGRIRHTYLIQCHWVACSFPSSSRYTENIQENPFPVECKNRCRRRIRMKP
jgi:hypothetical protein